ncbi:MAG: bifunctional diaminohydroxyphosphoribosylaminopyrimidine deaminase/5-amino-6-(5-phosphoribosylamino)uracil reductase RibD [Clostridium sp.]|nr:bifunctional diaminohydroxyphosphoribosylaminopyrimidine deaminase/5-amino-6-(5-phosphoribosylamino)uracil reductase RibD [Clostridium sp.]
MKEGYMKLALELAKKGIGRVHPNPMVGAVIVKDGKILGQGYHKKCGEGHAEVNAFKDAEEKNENVEGAEMYVTLEPCSHFGKTPPCADKIIEKKISKVFIGTLDPNPLVAGRGVKKLKDAGIYVEYGILESECYKLNEVFMKYIVKKEPFVVMKTGMSLDGKIATYSGESKWITEERSREDVHNLRNELTGIMVGINTVLKDNPQLTCRVNGGRNPIRIIVDSNLKIPMDCKIVNTAKEVETIIATTDKANLDKINSLEDKGVKIIVVPSKNGKVNLKELMTILGKLKIDSILLEGGGTLNFSALEEGIVDKVKIYIAPKIIGGKDSKTPIEGKGIDNLKDAFKITNLSVSTIGEDILVEGYVEKGDEN